MSSIRWWLRWPTTAAVPGARPAARFPGHRSRQRGLSATDQRGVARPQGAACDSGAFESRGFSLTKMGGDNQSTVINTAFAQPLSLTLNETGGNGLPGMIITFTAPASGASIADSTPITTSTDANGTVSLPVTANGVIGTYTVRQTLAVLARWTSH